MPDKRWLSIHEWDRHVAIVDTIELASKTEPQE